MDVEKIKRQVRQEISMWVGGESEFTRDFVQKRARQIFENMQKNKEYALDLDNSTREKIIGSLCDDFLGLGPLQKLMEDEEITEIMVNGPYNVYIEKEGKKTLSDIKFDNEAHLRYIIEKMLSPTGRRVDESFPYADFSLEDGSRVNVIIPPLTIGGAKVTIRKFLQSLVKVEDLIRLGTIDVRMAEFFVACIRAGVNILFSGATGSGKTTTLGILSSYLSPQERIITIEDAPELVLNQNHVVRLFTRPSNIEGKGSVPLRNLFRNTLRMRPTRVILGEIRGEEAMDYLQALNSGHRGCLAIIHASSPLVAITRLETMALYAGLNLPPWAIRQQISSGLDLIVQQEQLFDGSRKITYITEVGSLKENQITLRDIFRYEEEDQGDSKIKGAFKAKGVPDFYPLFKKKGIDIKKDIFGAVT